MFWGVQAVYFRQPARRRLKVYLYKELLHLNLAGITNSETGRHRQHAKWCNTVTHNSLTHRLGTFILLEYVEHGPVQDLVDGSLFYLERELESRSGYVLAQGICFEFLNNFLVISQNLKKNTDSDCCENE